MGKQIFMTWGGWPGHEPEQCTELVAGLLRGRGHDVTVVSTLEPLTDAAYLRKFDLIVPCWTMSTITGEQSRGLREAVLSGVGFGGWHGGAGDAFRNDTEYQFMVGGQWVAHPGGVIDYRVDIRDHDDPVTAGMADFPMRSELYYMHVDPSNHVLASATLTGEHCEWIAGTVMPVVWKRRYGKGRVFYSSLGHVAAAFTEPVCTILLRGLEWAMR